MSFEQTLMKLILRLPDSWLVRLSGGKPLTINGHTLDARLQFLDHATRKRPTINTLPVAHARAAADGFWSRTQGTPDPTVTTSGIEIQRNGRSIPAVLYQPQDQDPDTPLLVYFHMGGGVIGSVHSTDTFCTLLAAVTRGPVVSVDYRLAPEHPFPAGVEDAVAAYEWALGAAERYGAPAGLAAVGGDSMGGNFAAVICQTAREDQFPPPVLQLLIYPALDFSGAWGIAPEYADLSFLPKPIMDWFGELYLPEGQDPSDIQVSPGLMPNMDGLAPAIIVTAGFDAIRDHGPAYAKALRGDMVEVIEKRFETVPHGYTALGGVSPAAREACMETARLLAEGYRRWTPKS